MQPPLDQEEPNDTNRGAPSSPPPSRTLRIDVRYDGTDFAGWQVQPGQRTVQGEIERSLEELLGEKVRLLGAGRTDAGVHALRQTAHFRSAARFPWERLPEALAGKLPRDILVLSARAARDLFDARRDALSRTYRYRILRARDPLLRRFAWEIEFSLDIARMREGTDSLIGEHDFTSFAASTRKGMENLVRVERAEWTEADREILFEIEANRFLHHMVRNIVGTMVEVGRGFEAPARIPHILAARDRRLAGRTAPAHGLYLVSVAYEGGGDPAGPEDARRVE